MDSDNSSKINDYDEIDLFELVENLWSQKLLIALVSVCSVFLGYCYALNVPEKWTAEMHVSEASPSQISPLNPPELAIFERRNPQFNFSIVPDISPADLMTDLKFELQSVRSLLQFDTERAAGLIDNAEELTEAERVNAANGFLDSRLKITSPSETTTKTIIALTADSPDRVASLLTDYVNFVSAKVVNKRAERLKVAINRAIQTNEFEIEHVTRSYFLKLEEDIALAKEALRVTQFAGLKDNESRADFDMSGNRVAETNKMHRHEERLLEAKLQALEARAISTALIPEVRAIQIENELLRSIVIDTELASSFSLQKPPTPPIDVDSPQIKTILVLSLVLGGMLGVFTALIRMAIRNRKIKALA